MNAMTVEQFGERLGISRTSAYRLVAAGAVDVVDIAPTSAKPRLRIIEAAYQRFLSKREIKGRAA